MNDLYGPLDEKKKKRKKRKKAGSESSKESSLRDWFGRKGAKGKKKGWVDCNAPDGKGGYKSCGRSSGEKRKKYPACRPTPGACKERGKGKSWGKKAKRKSRKNEGLYMDLEQIIQEELEAVLSEKHKDKDKEKDKKKKIDLHGFKSEKETADFVKKNPSFFNEDMSDDDSREMQRINDELKSDLDDIGMDWIMDDENMFRMLDRLKRDSRTPDEYQQKIKLFLNKKADEFGYGGLGDEVLNEELEAVLDEKRKKKKKKKKKAKRDACYHKVKSRYKVWPSAYASGALVKCRKVGAKNWGNSTKESLEIEVQNEIELILHERTLKEQKIDKEHVFQRFQAAYEEVEDDPRSVEDNVDFVIRDEFPAEPEIQKYLQSIRGELIQKASSGALEEAECPEGTKKAGDGKCYPASPTDMGREYGQMPFEESGCGGDREHEATKTVKIIVREELQAVLDEKKKKKKKKSAKDRMKCNSSRRIRKGEPGYGKKKFVVKACEGGTEKIIRYGDANMEIKKDSPARRKSFRARHNCKNPGSKLKARYWSCKKW